MNISLIVFAETNKAPTSMSLSSLTIPENSGNGTVVGSLSVKDEDETPNKQKHTFQIVQQNPKDLFRINIVNELVVAADNEICSLHGGSNCALNFEENRFVSIRIRVTDNGTPPKSLETTFKIELTDVNELPRHLKLSNPYVAENATIGHVIGTFEFEDEDLNHQHNITLLDDNHGRFNVDKYHNLVIAKMINFEMETKHFINVLLQDNGDPPLSVSLTFGKFKTLVSLELSVSLEFSVNLEFSVTKNLTAENFWKV